MSADQTTHDVVKEYYGDVLQTSKDLKTNCCTAAGRPHQIIQELLKKVPVEVTEKFYGCGFPCPLGIEGLKVLDLGCGSGRDCYVVSALVGQEGSVTGIDMTRAQLEVACQNVAAYRETLGNPQINLEFVQGQIEDLSGAGIRKEAFDLVISNCVVNLSPDKPKVLSEVYRALKKGGEFYFSDVYCDTRLSKDVQSNKVLWGECIGGALWIDDFITLAKSEGFQEPLVLSKSSISIEDSYIQSLLKDAKFYSITFRLFKLPSEEKELPRNAGKAIIYQGSITGSETQYKLDSQHDFGVGEAIEVSKEIANILTESWLAKHFKVQTQCLEENGMQKQNLGPKSWKEVPDTNASSCCRSSKCC